MAGYTDFRIRFRHFLKKNAKIILIIIIVWLAVFIINLYYMLKGIDTTPQTTRDDHASVMDSSEVTPTKIASSIEDIIKQYYDYCIDGNYQAAFDMLSDSCKEYEFDNNIAIFMSHVINKIPYVDGVYSIQSYSTLDYGDYTVYVYEVKYMEDILATGLTSSSYGYTSEKMSFYKENNELQLNVGDYIFQEDLKNVTENDYLKIDVKSRIIDYGDEIYTVKITNKSQYYAVLADGFVEDEILLQISDDETRSNERATTIRLAPGESQTVNLEFTKYIDDGDISQFLMFQSVRIMESYPDDFTDEEMQNLIDNAVDKLSMSVALSSN